MSDAIMLCDVTNQAARRRANEVRTVLQPWPHNRLTWTEVYCRSSMGMELELALTEAVHAGLVEVTVGTARPSHVVVGPTSPVTQYRWRGATP